MSIEFKSQYRDYGRVYELCCFHFVFNNLIIFNKLIGAFRHKIVTVTMSVSQYKIGARFMEISRLLFILMIYDWSVQTNKTFAAVLH